jgi:uncharacterized protein (DUF2141 family)
MLALLGVSGSDQKDPVATLTVRITNLKNQDGQIGLSVFRVPTGWPEDWKQAERWAMVPIESNPQEIIISDLPVGRYAVSAFHDENSSGDIDKNFMGIPKEGYGVSNGAKAGMFGPPKFEEALINLDPTGTTIDIAIEY